VVYVSVSRGAGRASLMIFGGLCFGFLGKETAVAWRRGLNLWIVVLRGKKRNKTKKILTKMNTATVWVVARHTAAGWVVALSHTAAVWESLWWGGTAMGKFYGGVGRPYRRV
jgi:hypothetical protein